MRQLKLICNQVMSLLLLSNIYQAYGHWQWPASEIRVRTGPGKPGKSSNSIMAFSRTGKSWKKATGPGKFWKVVKLN